MFIQITEASVADGGLESLKETQSREHEGLRSMTGFRWAMLLKDLDTPSSVAAISMWLSLEQAPTGDLPLGDGATARGFDVATARGSMTPASHVAVVEWEVPEEAATTFTERWNAAYHAIEDRIGSRLLKDLDANGRYVGLHAVTAEANLDANVLGGELSAGEMRVTPQSVTRYEVVLLTEG